jgi:hypothetical protein
MASIYQSKLITYITMQVADIEVRYDGKTVWLNAIPLTSSDEVLGQLTSALDDIRRLMPDEPQKVIPIGDK